MKVQTMIQTAFFAILVLLSFAAICDSPDFLVEIRIVDSGTEIASPRMMVQAGSEASMSVSGENAVAVGLVVNSTNEHEVHVMAELESGEKTMSPELLIRKEQWASVSVGELEFHVRVKDLAANR